MQPHLKNQDTEEKIHIFWYENFSGLSDFELWHIGDYPITAGILAKAILVFLIGVLITRRIVHTYRKKTGTNSGINKHSNLIVQKFIYYSGFAISSVLGLWSLKSPSPRSHSWEVLWQLLSDWGHRNSWVISSAE